LELLLSSKDFAEVVETVKFDKSKWLRLSIDLEEGSKDVLMKDFEKLEQLKETVKAEYLDRKDVSYIERAFEHVDIYKDINKFVGKIDKTNLEASVEGISNDIERVFVNEANKTDYKGVYHCIKNMKATEANDIKNAAQIISAKQKDSKIALETKEMEIRSLCNSLSEALKAKIKILEQLKRDETSLAKPIAKIDTFKATSSEVTFDTTSQNRSSQSIVKMVEDSRNSTEPEKEDNVKIEDSTDSTNSSSNTNPASATPNGGDRCYVCKRPYMRSHQFYPKVRLLGPLFVNFIRFSLNELFLQMCNECGECNWQKRSPKVNLTGKIALVTGARVKIGYYTALMLLRNGATVIATTRFSRDAAVRFTEVRLLDSINFFLQ
jgi:hypothetical protein